MFNTSGQSENTKFRALLLLFVLPLYGTEELVVSMSSHIFKEHLKGNNMKIHLYNFILT